MKFRPLFIAGTGFLIGSTLSSAVALAWTGPTGTAPADNVSAPVNVSATAQVKNGALSVNTFTVFGNSLFSGFGVVGGSGRYLNFDYTQTGTSGTGSAGYGIRDNAGTLEFKNLGGTWDNKSTVTGNFVVTGNVTAAGYFHSSDARLKTNIVSAPGIELVQKLRGVTFDWKKDSLPSAGVIAQEVEMVMPSAVHTDVKTGFKSVEYDQLIAPLIEAVKEQQKEIVSLRHELDLLKASH